MDTNFPESLHFPQQGDADPWVIHPTKGDSRILGITQVPVQQRRQTDHMAVVSVPQWGTIQL